ncbi:MAG TPA: MMPL family transporter [Gemmatimonadaceae bacterium]|nr:MMPL family transporter [Gemmatimonadaceae bacterium]
MPSPRLVVLTWALLALALAPLAMGVERRLTGAAAVPGSESALVERELATAFGSPFARHAVLVVEGVPPPTDTAGERALRRVVEAVRRAPGVTRTLSWMELRDTLFLAAGGTFVVAGLDARTSRPDTLVAALRAATAPVEAALRRTHPAVRLRWTGELPLNADLRRASAEDSRRAELRALPLTLLLLVVVFGSLVAAALPVLGGVLAVTAALGLAALLARVTPLSVLLQNVVAMLGLGLGIDYALLVTGRFREELGARLDAAAAAAAAARSAGRTVLLSASTVAIGFAALLLVPLDELRSVAVGGLLVTITAALVAVTLLPALLAMLGARVGRVARARDVRGWRRWGAGVVRRPWAALLLAGVPLVLLALPATRLRTGLPRGAWLPSALESAEGVAALQRLRRTGAVQTVRVVLHLPRGVHALDGRGWTATRTLADRLSRDATVARVQALPTIAPLAAPDPLLLALVPAEARRGFVHAGGGAAALELLPAEDVPPEALAELVRALRRADAGALTGLPGARLLVGGLPAFNVDYEDAVAGALPRVIALVLGATMLVLAVAFRSVLVPLKAVLLNLLSVGAALGLVVLVFQDGHGLWLFGRVEPLGALFAAVPPLVFCVTFGLSMDYELFLLARVAEARRRGLGDGAAIVDGVARTGRVIGGAAAIMLVVFGAFALGDFVLVQVLGLALAAAVVIDATLVRLVLGPALLAIAGRWNWWPGERRRHDPLASGRAGSGARS